MAVDSEGIIYFSKGPDGKEHSVVEMERLYLRATLDMIKENAPKLLLGACVASASVNKASKMMMLAYPEHQNNNVLSVKLMEMESEEVYEWSIPEEKTEDVWLDMPTLELKK